MMSILKATADRREAIARTTATVVRLAARPELKERVDLHANIVMDGFYNDREAWESLHVLEEMVSGEGMLSANDAEPGDQGEGDPIDYPCEECGAEAGEQCRPLCTALPE